MNSDLRLNIQKINGKIMIELPESLYDFLLEEGTYAKVHIENDQLVVIVGKRMLFY